MRVVVLLLGFVGIFLTASFAMILIAWNAVLKFLAESVVAADTIGFLQTSISLTGIQHNDTAFMLLLTALYGLLGAVLGFMRFGKQGAALLIVPPIFAAFMNPYSLAFTWVQMFAGVLSFLVSPLPINAPTKEADDEAEEEKDEDDEAKDE
jgi:hypothetical protein